MSEHDVESNKKDDGFQSSVTVEMSKDPDSFHEETVEPKPELKEPEPKEPEPKEPERKEPERKEPERKEPERKEPERSCTHCTMDSTLGPYRSRSSPWWKFVWTCSYFLQCFPWG
uniref:Isoform 5 of Sodium/hydrogen exchanger 9B1 n=1 Tax=Mus musculus TaxID=10090 RepID=Q8C0X2-5|nr:unnamed protein product [Mus musculus]